MTLLHAAPLAIIVLAILGAPVREYLEFRREWGLGRLGALVTALALFPAFALGFAVSLPLAGAPAIQWLATVVVTLLAYSAATAAIRPVVSAGEAPRRSS